MNDPYQGLVSDQQFDTVGQMIDCTFYNKQVINNLIGKVGNFTNSTQDIKRVSSLLIPCNYFEYRRFFVLQKQNKQNASAQ